MTVLELDARRGWESYGSTSVGSGASIGRNLTITSDSKIVVTSTVMTRLEVRHEGREPLVLYLDEGGGNLMVAVHPGSYGVDVRNRSFFSADMHIFVVPQTGG